MARFVLFLIFAFSAQLVSAQDLRIASVERPPFASFVGDTPEGFSVELWQEVAGELGRNSTFVPHDAFASMLSAVETGDADAAVANISITAEREEVLDFSHTIFESGLQIMIPRNSATGSVWTALISADLLLAILLAFVALFGGGMLMWVMERRAQPYFDRPLREAFFPSFWWALNLLVNGGFEERVPRSFFGRIFGVVLVISSLFLVSVFVAKITSVMTVNAIDGTVNTVGDLYGKRVGTISESTSARFLDRRDIAFRGYGDLDALISGFENGRLDAVVFDAPILAHYVNDRGRDTAELIGSAFLRESYGIALPSDSPLAEPINQALLRIREDGRYERIYRKYFGATY